ncbi:hypothetical protein [Enterococcus sp. BWR-S5]|uniref:hypothetical protein n=1 Tax=Enterococcus sp. BWR-S5 TaxID=2787714 RepID=UPI00192148B8|nr:hypothetical protein [Enterococcus sp. BWR-S5]MBL1223642.1 hypothetical protein [Enterococcus sp. BWR-S5]
MYKKKMVVLGLITAGLLGGASESLARDERNPINHEEYHPTDYILAPSSVIREAIFSSIEGELYSQRRDDVLAELVSQYTAHSTISKEYGAYAEHFGWEDVRETRSFEGVNYLTNLKEISHEGGAIYDLRPISDLVELTAIEIDLQAGVSNLNALSRLTNLTTLHFSTRADRYYEDVTNGNLALTDISALDNMDQLEEIDINSRGELQPIVLRRGTTSYELFDPIIVSKQFEGATIEYSSYDSDFSVQDGTLIWNNITEGVEVIDEDGESYFEEARTEEVTFKWLIKAKPDARGWYRFIYEGDATIPIVWK